MGDPNVPTKTFEVSILGHSCGRSDRTLLNFIFEHPNCKSIRVYYYERDGDDNYRLVVKSPFVEELITDCCDFRWVDIENKFYKNLKLDFSVNANREEGIGLLNGQLELLKNKLGEYLEDVKPGNTLPAYERIFQQPSFIRRVTKMSSSMILNFNYTNQGRLYENDNLKSIYIHGDLNDKRNPLIFGFGDEPDDMYADFKRDERYGCSQHLKSFAYTMTDSFHRLQKFLDDFAGEQGFEVIILGHSCGRSDRTLLNYVFEHPHCKGIKAYYYQEDGVIPMRCFRKISDNIARQFNITRFYAKVQPYIDSQRMPQWNNELDNM